jgi:hypothetical protein
MTTSQINLMLVSHKVVADFVLRLFSLNKNYTVSKQLELAGSALTS